MVGLSRARHHYRLAPGTGAHDRRSEPRCRRAHQRRPRYHPRRYIGRGFRMNTMNECPPSSCAGCQHHVGNLVKLGVDMERFDYVVALAGNPNTGQSTGFNSITGLRQHTGNWPGKTVARAEGGFALDGRRYKLVDLPGTYSLLSTTVDEEIARNFILFARPDVTVIVVDASH